MTRRVAPAAFAHARRRCVTPCAKRRLASGRCARRRVGLGPRARGQGQRRVPGTAWAPPLLRTSVARAYTHTHAYTHAHARAHTGTRLLSRARALRSCSCRRRSRQAARASTPSATTSTSSSSRPALNPLTPWPQHNAHTHTHTHTRCACGALLGVLRCDILSPCAYGGVLHAESVAKIKARIVCGAANNREIPLGLSPSLGRMTPGLPIPLACPIRSQLADPTYPVDPTWAERCRAP